MSGRGWPLLAALTGEEQREVLAAARRRKYRKGEVIFHEGDPGAALHLVDKGTVAIKVTNTLGDTTTLGVLGPGECMGEQALVGADDIRTATAVALEAVETLAISRDAFNELRAKHRSADRFLIEVLAARARRLNEQLAEALFVPADSRVLRRLLDLRQHYAPKNGTTVVPLTQTELAMLAGTTRPTANRVLRTMEEAGAIRLRRGCIEIVDDAILTRRAR